MTELLASLDMDKLVGAGMCVSSALLYAAVKVDGWVHEGPDSLEDSR